MEYPEETNEEFSARMDRLTRESEERIAKMTPAQQEALKKAARRHQRKVRDELETSFVVGVRKKLETNPDEVDAEEYQAYLRILEKDKERERRKAEE